MKKRICGTLMLLMCTVIWGLAIVAQSVGMDHVGPFTFQAVRCFLAVLGLLPICIVFDRFKNDGKTFISRWKDKNLWKAGFLCGIPLFLACNLQQLGLVDTDAGKSAFLTAMYIIIVPILGIFLKRKPSKMIPVCVVLATAGLYCLSCVGVTKINIGDVLLLGCAFAFAVQIIMINTIVRGSRTVYAYLPVLVSPIFSYNFFGKGRLATIQSTRSTAKLSST